MNRLKIRWAPPLRPALLKKLYDADAAGIRDMDLCDEVGTTLFARCQTFMRVAQHQVVCPRCHTVFTVKRSGRSRCPGEDCAWETTYEDYVQSLRNYNAHTGRALKAYATYTQRYPHARTYQDKVVLIDQLIHSFHINEKTGQPVKSVASKLLEGNKKAVVRFLDALSAIDPLEKEYWRHSMAKTIDHRLVQRNANEEK